MAFTDRVPVIERRTHASIGMTENPHANPFTQADHTKDPDFLIRFMDETVKLPAIQSSKRLMPERSDPEPANTVLDIGCGPGIDRLDVVEQIGSESQSNKRLMPERIGPEPGNAALDIGCGPGIDTLDMVEQVGSAGRLVGLGASEVMLTEAEKPPFAIHSFIPARASSDSSRNWAPAFLPDSPTQTSLAQASMHCSEQGSWKRSRDSALSLIFSADCNKNPVSLISRTSPPF
ncbi:MAG TPA: hypothetical protein VNJ52_01580, partial [Patescibacteria group bacterium]|nr:hypothetical protein [Patescibacteria group bacterium]